MLYKVCLQIDQAEHVPVIVKTEDPSQWPALIALDVVRLAYPRARVQVSGDSFPIGSRRLDSALWEPLNSGDEIVRLGGQVFMLI